MYFLISLYNGYFKIREWKKVYSGDLINNAKKLINMDTKYVRDQDHEYANNLIRPDRIGTRDPPNSYPNLVSEMNTYTENKAFSLIYFALFWRTY